MTDKENGWDGNTWPPPLDTSQKEIFTRIWERLDALDEPTPRPNGPEALLREREPKTPSGYTPSPKVPMTEAQWAQWAKDQKRKKREATS